MCELMGICANLEVNAQFSFKEILTRGGGTKPDIGDGWGMGLYTGACSTVYKEPKAAFDSKLAKKIGNMEFKSKIFVSHIRQMAGSRRSLENTHPFERRLFDQDWLFAHNGKDGLGAYYNSHPKVRDCFKPKGETGSEKGFALILNALKEKNATNIEVQRDIIKKLADDIARVADFNIIMSNSEYLFCYYSGYNFLYYVERSYANDRNLILKDADFEVNISEMKVLGEKAIVVATEKLTYGEDWQPFKPHELIIFKDGVLSQYPVENRYCIQTLLPTRIVTVPNFFAA